MADPTGGGYQRVVEEVDVEETVDPATEQRETVDQFLRLAQERFRTISDAESELRQKMLEDLRIRASDQWPEHVRSQREQDQRPCLTINRLPQFIRQVTNNQRASRPAVAVSPTGDEGDPEIAEVFQGLVRHIEVKSDADVAYTTAGEHQVTMGRGYVRVITDYIDDDPTRLDQEIKVQRVQNPFSVYVDPASQNPDGSDARYAFVVEDMPVEEYRWRYPRSAMAALSEFTSTGNAVEEWMPEGSVRVAEYFYLEEEKQQMALVETMEGERVRIPRSSLPSDPEELESLTIVAEREVVLRKVRWALINAVEILEGSEDKTEGMEWPGKYIPIIPVLGDEININGVKDYRGIVRDSQDPQRMYNYWVSAQTEMIALAPRAPFIGAEGQFEGHGAKWDTANTRNYPYLEYKQTSLSGQLAPPPQRQPFEPPIQAMTMAIAQSDNDLKSTGGFNDASLGIRGAQESGRAIRSRQQQDEMANSHYLDNLGRAVRQVGRILVDLIPKIYDVARVVRILGEDNNEKNVMVFSGQENQPSATQEPQLPPGLDGIYDLNVGRYDVTVSVGPSFQTKRQEAVDSLIQFVQSYPDAFPMIGDLLAENMDWPGAKQVAARLKKMLPPQLRDDMDPRQVPPAVQAHLQQLEQQLQQVSQAYEQAQNAIQTDQVKEGAKVKVKEMELAADAASQERDTQARVQLEEIRQQGENARALAKIEQQRASEILTTEINRLEKMIDRDVDFSNREQDRYERMVTNDEAQNTGTPAQPPQGPPPNMPPQGGPPGGGPPMMQGPPPGRIPE